MTKPSHPSSPGTSTQLDKATVDNATTPISATIENTWHTHTELVHAGRDPDAQHGIVNPPIYHASTVTFPTMAALETAASQPMQGVYYGRYGTPTTFAFEAAVAKLDGGYARAISTSSGLAAITTTLLSYLSAGDHLLMVDSVYEPTRKFCDQTLANLGIETSYFSPHAGADIAALIRPNTRLVFLESPGSLTFEVQDIPTVTTVAKAHNLIVAIDNTWATPLFFKPFAHGIDISIQAATKYIVGHADAMLGVITTAHQEHFTHIKKMAVKLGQCAGPEACWLGLRGLRTLAARLERHQRSALLVANWLQLQPQVEQVLYPALPSDPNHTLWQRDFSGASGLLGVILKPGYNNLADMLDPMELFAMGFSWGGYESLILPANIQRSLQTWPADGRTLRLHIGLENPHDLIRDIAYGLQRLQPREPEALTPQQPPQQPSMQPAYAVTTSSNS